MALTNQVYGNASRVAATATQVVSSVNSAIIGIMFNGTGTNGASIYSGQTATTTNFLGKIIAYATVTGATANAAIYYPFPANSPGGITVAVIPSADPSLTIFWNPAG